MRPFKSKAQRTANRQGSHLEDFIWEVNSRGEEEIVPVRKWPMPKDSWFRKRWEEIKQQIKEGDQ